MTPDLFLGIDLGTSGCRAVAIDALGEARAEAAVDLPPPLRQNGASEQDPALWWEALLEVLRLVAGHIDPATVRALAVDGTSATLLLTDAAGAPLGPALMYDDARARAEAARIAAVAPPDSGAYGPSSALAKLLHLQDRAGMRAARHALHQADWIAGRLCGTYGLGDENNGLKLGYDAVERRWPDWLDRLGVRRELLPRVVPPGRVLGTLRDEAVRRLGYREELRVVAGTTDSVAAFLAASSGGGAMETGTAVTSLGSTLVLKVLTERPLFAPEFGVYSHRLGDRWLAGGASNSGGRVLRHFFSQAELDALTPRLDPGCPTGLEYYPLTAPGERFPHSDPAWPPRLTPRPADDVVFFQAMLEGIARIEAEGYRRLAKLGAPYPTAVSTVGGGARNAAWTAIRRERLGVPLRPARSEQACHGAARLARGAVTGNSDA
ncbi:MAG: FGGY-family carbohydrate kinase [Gammaproteobacteria bacterium]|nr:FGGY-family carbohydrate kinase [Gammaproteobacteria bacterium]